MRTPRELPTALGHTFSLSAARSKGVTPGQRQARVHAAGIYLPRLHPDHFFSHHTAASIWGAPLPIEFAPAIGSAPAGEVADADELDLHVASRGNVDTPRGAGITGHRSLEHLISVRIVDGFRVTSPASTWAMMGGLSIPDLIAMGDYFCRVWRTGYGRPNVGKQPLATLDELRTAAEAGRRLGAARLREALTLIREDAWSPRESQLRCILVSTSLPEPELNVDIFEGDRFLACVDLVYRKEKVAIEYLGMLHGEQYARDVERMARLRASGWTVIKVTSALIHRPDELVARVRRALKR